MLRNYLLQDLAIGASAFFHPEAHVGRNQWFNSIKEKIVELRARLPPNFDCILKPSRGHQSNARSLALQQRIRAHSSSVQKNRGVCPSLREHFHNCLRGIRRSRKSFGDANTPFLHPNAVSKRAASIDSHAEFLFGGT